ncbi:hypothetical protein sos41_13910 [Alphaproteobacteria bacterium SO-S41]|nr:hypothetical protein sos41_13910 [Alphaproteobacteria bacterium SO-S41]
MTLLAHTWELLQLEARTEAGWHLRRILPTSPCEIFAALHQPDGTPGLVLEVSPLSFGSYPEIPVAVGFRLVSQLIGHSRNGRVRVILSLADPAYSAVFSVLCMDCAECLANEIDERSALARFVGRLLVWQEFMERRGTGGLPEKAALGLMGELVVLADLIAPKVGWSRAVRSWSGPDGEVNDFCLDRLFLEVKATTRQVTKAIEISNADQLDPSRGNILLAHASFQPTDQGETLPSLVDRIRQRLAIEALTELPVFTERLLKVGYLDADRDLYSDCFRLRKLDLYNVSGSFPHLSRNDLRDGVLECSYSLSLDACECWRTSPDDIVGLRES